MPRHFERISLIAFTEVGGNLACKLAKMLSVSNACTDADVYGMGRALCVPDLVACTDLSSWAAERFQNSQAIVFVGATGIAVRAIAPHVRDKFLDPAVVSIDERGMFAVPLLSGHVGGANDLARALSQITSGTAVISTATDVEGIWAPDTWAAQNGLVLLERDVACKAAAQLLTGQALGFRSSLPIEGEIPPNITAGETSIGTYLGFSAAENPFPLTLHACPATVFAGIGCRRGTAAPILKDALTRALDQARIDIRCVRGIASIDLKADEPGLAKLAEELRLPIAFFAAHKLQSLQGAFSESPFVEATVGVSNVCERAAVAAAGPGSTLLLPKTVFTGVTVALAASTPRVSFPKPTEESSPSKVQGGL